MTGAEGDLWRVDVLVPAPTVPVFTAALERVGETVLAFVVTGEEKEKEETEKDERALWQVSAFCRTPPDRADVTTFLALAAAAVAGTEPAFTVHRVAARDWARENLAAFPPFTVGRFRRFHVRGAHVAAPPPAATMPLVIEATAAFGTGEHQSTQGCLLALERLARGQRRGRVLDMGCGTRILALAAAKMWRARVLAVDIEPSAVRIAAFNARRNGLHPYVQVRRGDGFRTVRGAKSFDVILANILARPLTRMAHAMAKALSCGGRVVLSGVLVRQERMLLAACRRQGLFLEHRIVLSPWLTMIVRKNQRRGKAHPNAVEKGKKRN
ncbi:MAG: ribosomal protein L11 methyltransferase [Rhodospirillaceae bacterium]|nr:MAG: ribosomal protein L11 methyltransferase [Rhodospirillaceae bacterium]